MTESFSRALKKWRKIRRLSQLDLALEADVSSRHISFLETGRANPSTTMINRLGDALQLPLSARNQLMLHAGFAPRYRAREWDHEEMSPIRNAVDHMLQTHLPFPAIAIDHLWNVQMMNQTAAMLFGQLGVQPGESLLELMKSKRIKEVIENWEVVAHHAAIRLRTESTAQGGIEALERAADNLSAQARAPEDSTGPVIPAIYRAGSMRLSLFTTIAQFGTPDDMMLDDLRIELFFPSDESTADFLRSLGSQPSVLN